MFKLSQVAQRTSTCCLLVVKIDVYTLKCNANVPQLKTGYIFRELGNKENFVSNFIMILSSEWTLLNIILSKI